MRIAARIRYCHLVSWTIDIGVVRVSFGWNGRCFSAFGPVRSTPVASASRKRRTPRRRRRGVLVWLGSLCSRKAIGHVVEELAQHFVREAEPDRFPFRGPVEAGLEAGQG